MITSAAAGTDAAKLSAKSSSISAAQFCNLLATFFILCVFSANGFDLICLANRQFNFFFGKKNKAFAFAAAHFQIHKSFLVVYRVFFSGLQKQKKSDFSDRRLA